VRLRDAVRARIKTTKLVRMLCLAARMIELAVFLKRMNRLSMEMAGQARKTAPRGVG